MKPDTVASVPPKKDLKALFEPQTIAVVGASRRPEAVGYAITRNLLSTGYKGKIYLVNPKADEIMGMKCYPSVADIPGVIDLAMFIIPAAGVPAELEACAQKGAKAAIVISAGFREVGPEGLKLEKQVQKIAEQYGVAVLGPNCLGLINNDPEFSMNASFAGTIPMPGNVAFVSQSGALGTALLDYARGENIGFSKFVSLGNKVGVTELEVLHYLKDDPKTSVIIMYLEDIVKGQEFIELSREITGEIAKTKPILVIKSGRTKEGAKAASSHTGSLMGSDEVYDAVFAQSGVMRMNSAQEMFGLAVAFANQPLMKGNRVAIVTNAGGPGIMATDACVKAGLKMAEMGSQTVSKLKEKLPPTSNFSNPIDVIGDARHDRYEHALRTVIAEPNVDGIMVLLTPQAMTEAEATARVIVELDKISDKTIVTCFMGHSDVDAGVKILKEHNIPHYRFPEAAAGALAAMNSYQKWLGRQRTGIKHYQVDRERVCQAIKSAAKADRKFLPINESMEIFNAYGFPVIPWAFVRTQEEACESAAKIGFPVVMKVVSQQIIHKVDVGGVRLNLNSAEDVRDAFQDIMAVGEKLKAKIDGVFMQRMALKGREVILGMKRDPQFGPVLMFGLGGIYVEALKDVTFRVAPIRELSARDMVCNIRAAKLLQGIRGEPPADLAAVEDCLKRLSQLSCDHPEIEEIDINPLMVYAEGKGAGVIDARIILK
ncbi:MAG: succinyl-CoA synthetase subunit alpha [Candidatus Omnitrophica bacterium ADurb.Bin292]|jgi:acetyltransferase|nr:MAG: succinyl-CoA synthetase subunit alpha [Candidatus Omnitrophica bacterium ADurb.Bin292]HPW76940.1 acetate--CoA ligase family protein [Candidatus Omnitrophota bacterium]HQB12482.1 acetate--CoA ligase family protein [Candidatus Omnitrophota bacterium]